jgi:hypothetical protein
MKADASRCTHLWAQLLGDKAWHGAAHPKLARQVVGCADHAHASNSHRLVFEIRPVKLLDTAQAHKTDSSAGARHSQF